jgi:hypothetical protein
MTTFKLPNIGAPPEANTLLFLAWVQYFAEQRLGSQQRSAGVAADGSGSFHFGDPTKGYFSLEGSSNGDWSVKASQGIAEEDIDAIIKEARQRHASGDFGGDVVYQTSMRAQAFSMNPDMMSHFMRILNDQVYITGLRRLGGRVLLEFTPAPPEDPTVPQLFVPKTDIKVSIFAPGPTASELTDLTAAGIAEFVGGICALALGRVIEMPLAIFPAEPEEAAAAQALRHDNSIPNLARDHISLDVFDEFMTLGGPDGVLRIRGALLSYHAALQQANPDVALMLMVTSLEALIVPRQAWRKERATKRFIEAIAELCPDVVDSVVNHGNVEQAFEYKRKGGTKARRRQLLDRIYELRSNPTHSGIGLVGIGIVTNTAESGKLRVALLSILVRGALLRFLQLPRSSLIGHPMFEQDAARVD